MLNINVFLSIECCFSCWSINSDSKLFSLQPKVIIFFDDLITIKNTFKKYKWPSIDVTRKSVEETAASIIKIYEIFKENA